MLSLHQQDDVDLGPFLIILVKYEWRHHIFLNFYLGLDLFFTFQ